MAQDRDWRPMIEVVGGHPQQSGPKPKGFAECLNGCIEECCRRIDLFCEGLGVLLYHRRLVSRGGVWCPLVGSRS